MQAFLKGGFYMSKNNGYAGKIKNSGSQKVTAPFPSDSKKGTSSVKKGSDLRTGK